MSEDVKYILKRVLIGVLIFLAITFIKTRDVRALDTVSFNEWNFVYRDSSVGQTWDNSFIYRLGENKSLQAVNVYWPSFQGYYNGTITIQLDPVQFPSDPNGFLTNQFFKLFVYQNGSYSQQYYVGTCDGQWTCTYNFQGTAEQLSTNRFSVQLLMNNDAFSTAYIMYPAARISASVFVSNESNTGNQDIINNQNDNTQNIINNQNENTEKEIESQTVCKLIDKSYIKESGLALSASGGTFSTGNAQTSAYGISDFISIKDVKKIVLLNNDSSLSNRICFYNDNYYSNATFISCLDTNNANLGELTIPSNATFVRVTINKELNKPTYNFCYNGNQAINDQLENITDPTITPGLGENYFDNFDDGGNPLQDILMFPITLLQASTTSCSPITLPVLNQNVIIPCGTTIFWDKPYAQTFRTWWNLFVGGLACYYLCLRLFHVINDAVDPTKDGFEKLGGL